MPSPPSSPFSTNSRFSLLPVAESRPVLLQSSTVPPAPKKRRTKKRRTKKQGLAKLSEVLNKICILKTDSDSETNSDFESEKNMLQLDGPLDSASSEGSTSSTKFQVKAVRRIRGKTIDEEEDESFFRPKETLEDEIKNNPKSQILNYLGNLKIESGFQNIKDDTLSLIDCDIMGNLKQITKDNIILVKLLKCKTENDAKRHLPICLKCNFKHKTDIFISSINKNTKVSMNVKEANIKSCIHSEVSEVLFDKQESKDANKSISMCKVITDDDKQHLATSFDGQSHGLIHINKARKANKAQCFECKSTKCNHTKEWNKELKNIVIGSMQAEKAQYEQEEEDTDFKSKPHHKLEYPFDKETQCKMRHADSTKYNTMTHFVPKKGGVCPHNKPWDESDPIERDWIYSSDVKIAHSTYIEDRERRAYYRSELGQKHLVQSITFGSVYK